MTRALPGGLRHSLPSKTAVSKCYVVRCTYTISTTSITFIKLTRRSYSRVLSRERGGRLYPVYPEKDQGLQAKDIANGRISVDLLPREVSRQLWRLGNSI